MKVDLFLTADYANITGDGKLNVMGIFREINAYSFPARHSLMHLVIRFEAELGEFGQSRVIHVKLLDGVGKELMAISGNINIPEIKKGMIPQVNAVIELRDIVFPIPGIYQFVVLIDKDHKGSIPVYLNLIDQPPKSQEEK